MTSLFLLGLVGLGALHGLGPDHVAALGTLAARGGGARQALITALRLGVAHAAMLAVGAALSLGLGLAIPDALARVLEIGGGALVALLGLAAVAEAAGLRLHRHGPPGPDGIHAHVGHAHEHRNGEGRAPVLVGAALAASGIRALLVLLPAAGAGTPLLAAAGVLCFGVGVVASMAAVVLAGSFALRLLDLRREGTARLARGAIGLGAMVVGASWAAVAIVG